MVDRLFILNSKAMKTLKKLSIKFLALAAICLAVPTVASAQNVAVINYSTETFNNYYLNGDWQFNVPISNDFANKASGWGMSFDGGYYFTPNWGVGAFLAFNTNHKYVPTQTLQFDDATLTTNQQHSVFQLPFGLSGRYRIMPGNTFDPYISLKLGPNYTQMSSYFSTFKAYDRTWGFYMSPEIGANVWLTPNQSVGLHFALYYSYATNKSHVLTYSMDNLNNFGFRVGLAF